MLVFLSGVCIVKKTCKLRPDSPFAVERGKEAGPAGGRADPPEANDWKEVGVSVAISHVSGRPACLPAYLPEWHDGKAFRRLCCVLAGGRNEGLLYLSVPTCPSPQNPPDDGERGRSVSCLTVFVPSAFLLFCIRFACVRG